MKLSRLIALMIAAALPVSGCGRKSSPDETVAAVTVKVGHVGHDHQIALFVAADNAERFSEKTGILLKPLRDKDLYELLDNGRKLADVEIVMVGGGSKMPTALAQGVIDIGFGGLVPTLAIADKGAPVKVIAPLHSKGNMLVVRPDLAVSNWEKFVAYVSNSETPVKIGYKDPIAVAKLMLEEALKHEGLNFSDDISDTNAKIHLINTKGGGKLNTALSSGIIDGYVGNNPFPAIGLEKKILRIVCDLEDLPPGTLRNYPCCCIAANATSLEKKQEAIAALLTLFKQATDLINSDIDAAVASATRWIGTSRAVERNSIPTSGYSMDATPEWRDRAGTWLKIMQGLNVFEGEFKTATQEQAEETAYDLSLLSKAEERLGK